MTPTIIKIDDNHVPPLSLKDYTIHCSCGAKVAAVLFVGHVLEKHGMASIARIPTTNTNTVLSA